MKKTDHCVFEGTLLLISGFHRKSRIDKGETYFSNSARSRNVAEKSPRVESPSCESSPTHEFCPSGMENQESRELSTSVNQTVKNEGGSKLNAFGLTEERLSVNQRSRETFCRLPTTKNLYPVNRRISELVSSVNQAA